MGKNIVIIGSSGAIGGAFTQHLAALHPDATVHAYSRTPAAQAAPPVVHHLIDYADEASIAAAASQAAAEAAIDMVVVATGILHTEEIKPEKSLRDLSADKLQHLFAVNAVVPALVAKHFLPQLNRDQRSVFVALSAHAGSISDNDIGGWYAYRASKVALNMLIKNAAIEVGRRNKQAVIVGLHPGTVDSYLSEPFKKSLPADRLFTPAFAAEQSIRMLDRLTPEHTGRCFEWDGQEMAP